jgi:hypothetical protein
MHRAAHAERKARLQHLMVVAASTVVVVVMMMMMMMMSIFRCGDVLQPLRHHDVLHRVTRQRLHPLPVVDLKLVGRALESSAAAVQQQLTVAYAPELRRVTSFSAFNQTPLLLFIISSRSYPDSCCVISCLDLVSACRVALSGRQLEDSFLLQHSKWWVSCL